MKALVLNVGSSSIKYSVFDGEKRILTGIFERLRGNAQFSLSLRKIAGLLARKRIRIDAVGHRVVHGGTIEKPCRITASLLRKLEKVSELAPLHNPPQIRGIRTCRKLFSAPQVAVFDTAFHQAMPARAYTYAIPSGIAANYGIRRYGFHGTSHKYVAHEACRKVKKDIRKQKIITCHLGNGCSVTAIKNGKSIDTSMGFTPLEGLVMGTRSGDIDPAIVTFLMEKGFSRQKVYDILNHRSGLLGISGVSNDMRTVMKSKSKKAKLAVDVFCYRAAKYIGAYAAALGGVDILVFTGGIGEHSLAIRKKIIGYLKHMKIKNIVAVKTDEEKMIVREVKEVLRK